MYVELEGIRKRRLAARLMARRYAAEVVRRTYDGPILNRRMLRRLADPARPAAVMRAVQREERASHEGDGEDSYKSNSGDESVSMYQMIGLRRQRIARSHTATLNKLLGAAPEAKVLGVPFSLLRLLIGGEESVTARLLVNEATIESLKLPKDLKVTHTLCNKQKREIKNVRGVDPKTKLLKGDELTLRAWPHRLALSMEVKGGVLALAGGAASSGGAGAMARLKADADALAKGHALLLSVANRIAKWLQDRVRIKVAKRLRARRAHAALVIQLGLAYMMVNKRYAEGNGASRSFVSRPYSRRSFHTKALRGTPPTSVLGTKAIGIVVDSSVEGAIASKHWEKLKRRHSVVVMVKTKHKQKRKPSAPSKSQSFVSKGGAEGKSSTNRKSPPKNGDGASHVSFKAKAGSPPSRGAPRERE